jgi:HK97 family phage major capsid protein
MAFQNEVAPNTTEQHQGRLAYLEEDFVPKEIVGPIFEKAQESSLVLRLGEQIPVTYGETVIPVNTKRPEVGQVGVGTSNAQREGYVKPVSGVAWSSKSFSPIKLATIVTASEEFARRNPQGLFTQIQTDMAYAIGRGFDLAVFHGKRPDTGGALLGIDPSNVLANTTNALTLGATDNTYDKLLDAYETVVADQDFTGWAVDPRLRARLIRDGAEKDSNGNLVAPRDINLQATSGNILGYRAEYGKAVAGDLGAATNSGVKVVGGDFSQLRFGFADEIRFKISDQATVEGVSMWQTNQIAILIEVTFGWIVGDLDAFAKVSTAVSS